MIPCPRLVIAVEEWPAVALPIFTVLAPGQHRVTESIDFATRVARQIIAQDFEQADHQVAAIHHATNAVKFGDPLVAAVGRDNASRCLPIHAVAAGALAHAASITFRSILRFSLVTILRFRGKTEYGNVAATRGVP